MVTVEIYERESGEVIETITMDDTRDFLHYWRMQCNSSVYGYRYVAEPPVAERTEGC